MNGIQRVTCYTVPFSIPPKTQLYKNSSNVALLRRINGGGRTGLFAMSLNHDSDFRTGNRDSEFGRQLRYTILVIS